VSVGRVFVLLCYALLLTLELRLHGRRVFCVLVPAFSTTYKNKGLSVLVSGEGDQTKKMAIISR
jgi:hypothetical protein